jgi:hypothetical protein
MESLRQSAHRYLRIAAPLSVRSVAGELAVPARSVRDLLDRLRQHRVVFSSGSLLPSSVKGTATLILCSDGMWEFSGHVHENGFLKHNYVLAAAMHVVDEANRVFAVANDGSVTDSRDDDFQHRGWDRRVSAHWDQLKTGPVTFRLEVGLDRAAMGELLLALLTPILIAAGVVYLVASGGPVRKDPATGSYSKEF